MDDFLRPKRRSPLDVSGPPARPASVPTQRSRPSFMLDIGKRPVIIPDNIKEPKFVPPEEIVDDEIIDVAQSGEPKKSSLKDKKLHKIRKKKRFALRMPHGKKQWIVASAVIVLLLGGGASAYWFVLRKPAVPAVVVKVEPKIEEPVKPTTEVSKLSGLTVPLGTNLKPVTAVMIENSPDARPQSGLREAGVVFEAIAEGGITRFSAVYQDTAPTYVGPIRSVRPYYLDWIWPFDAAIAHVGGSPQALADIRSLGIKDLDQFANSGFYDRVTSRFAPHNVYTSITRLNALEEFKKYTTADFTGFARKAEAKIAVPTAKSISLDISSFYYNVQYTYDPSTNAYKRAEGGEAHKDEKSGVQLAPNVVVAIVMGRGIASDGQHTEYKTTAGGRMFVFQDGAVLEGTWSKANRQAQWVFTDTAGKPIAFNPGQTWISMVDTAGSVIYTP